MEKEKREELLKNAVDLIAEGKEQELTEEQWSLIVPLRKRDNENMKQQIKTLDAYDISTGTGNIHIPLDNTKGVRQEVKILGEDGLFCDIVEFIDSGLWKTHNKNLTIYVVLDRDGELWNEIDYKTKEPFVLHTEDKYFVSQLDCIRKIKQFKIK